MGAKRLITILGITVLAFTAFLVYAIFIADPPLIDIGSGQSSRNASSAGEAGADTNSPDGGRVGGKSAKQRGASAGDNRGTGGSGIPGKGDSHDQTGQGSAPHAGRVTSNGSGAKTSGADGNGPVKTDGTNPDAPAGAKPGGEILQEMKSLEELLKDAVTVNGLAQDDAGQPVEGASITFSGQFHSKPDGTLTPLEIGPATSAATGAFTAQVPVGVTFSIVASRTGYKPSAPLSRSFAGSSGTSITLAPLVLTRDMAVSGVVLGADGLALQGAVVRDRKSTRLNSSH